jgi:hypothetical protein
MHGADYATEILSKIWRLGRVHGCQSLATRSKLNRAEAIKG